MQSYEYFSFRIPEISWKQIPCFMQKTYLAKSFVQNNELYANVCLVVGGGKFVTNQ